MTKPTKTPSYGLTPNERARLIACGLMTPPPPEPPQAEPADPTIAELEAAIQQKTTRVLLPDGREVTRGWCAMKLKKLRREASEDAAEADAQ